MSAEHDLPEEIPSFFTGTTKRLLLVASTGGHLLQLVKLAAREGAADDSLWVTFDSPQSRSLLRDKQVMWVDYVAPRDVRGTANVYRRLANELDARQFDGVLSTGAAVGIAGLAWARKNRIPSVYVESVSRTEGPSLTGRIVRATRLAETYTQHASWATTKWQLTESVLKEYGSSPAPAAPETALSPASDHPLRVLVTLGTIRPYRFDRLIDRVLDIVRPNDHVVWQLGETQREDLPGETHALLKNEQLIEEALRADVVITHSGVGTILELLDHGVQPIVVPRRSEWNEHVDNHQLQIFTHLQEQQVAHPVEVADLSLDTLFLAARPVIEYDGPRGSSSSRDETGQVTDHV